MATRSNRSSSRASEIAGLVYEDVVVWVSCLRARKVSSANGRRSVFVGLAAALEVLREELETAWEQGWDKSLHFRVSDITLEIQVVARRETEGGGKIRWYLIEAGAGATSITEATQRLILTLSPGLRDAQGNEEPLEVGDRQLQPGR